MSTTKLDSTLRLLVTANIRHGRSYVRRKKKS